jgi:hypothetical protein
MLTTCSLTIFWTAEERENDPTAYIFFTFMWYKLFKGHATHLPNTFHWEFEPADYLRADQHPYLQNFGKREKGRPSNTFLRTQKAHSWSSVSQRFLVMFFHLFNKTWMLSRKEEAIHCNIGIFHIRAAVVHTASTSQSMIMSLNLTDTSCVCDQTVRNFVVINFIM